MIKPEVFEAIGRERQWQLTKHGEWHSKPSFVIADWLDILESELLEVATAESEAEFMQELLQVVTVGCAILSHFGVVERNYGEELTMLQNGRKLDEADTTGS